MARSFDRNFSQHLIYGGAPVTAAPMTFSALFDTYDTSVSQEIIAITNIAITDTMRIIYSTGSSTILGISQVAGTDGVATATSSVSQNIWHHAAAVFTSITSRDIYLDGGSKGSNTTSVSPSGLASTKIAILNPLSNTVAFKGEIAEVAIWNVALTSAEISILASHYSPLFVRPQSLVAYWPIIGRTSPEIDIVGGFNMTLANDPQPTAHPRIIYPSYPQVGLHFTPASAASPYMTTSPGLWGPL